MREFFFVDREDIKITETSGMDQSFVFHKTRIRTTVITIVRTESVTR
jgi:hypothetical protein